MPDWNSQPEDDAWNTTSAAASDAGFAATDAKVDSFTVGDNVSKHAYSNATDVSGGNSGGGGNGYVCRNCGVTGHFSKDCPEPKQLTGECFNCGQIGHNKSECTNAKVERPFSGTCHVCSEEGHRAAECPKKPSGPCKNCGATDHNQAKCTAPRNMGLDQVEDKTLEEAMQMLDLASKEKQIADFQKAIRVYSKANPSATYADLEKYFREQKFNIYLIAMDRPMPKAMTSVDLSGKQDCKYQVTYQFSTKPRRAIYAPFWPTSVEDNLERLKDAGEPMERLVPICLNCRELGHVRKYCPEERRERMDIPKVICSNCSDEGHRARDCSKPVVDRYACRNCGRSGHRASDCQEPRSAANVECRRCGEMGHFAKDCPSGGGGGNACHNCGQEGHRKNECPEPLNPDNIICRNCDEKGHMSRDCPQPRDWSRVTCSNCGEKGHGRGRCPQPPADQHDDTAADNRGAHDAGFGGGAADFGDAAAGGASSGGGNDWSTPKEQDNAGGSGWGADDTAATGW